MRFYPISHKTIIAVFMTFLTLPCWAGAVDFPEVERNCYGHPVLLTYQDGCPKMNSYWNEKLNSRLATIDFNDSTYKQLAKAKGVIIEAAYEEYVSDGHFLQTNQELQKEIQISNLFNWITGALIGLYILFKLNLWARKYRIVKKFN
jgi:hypothetical protein